MVSFVERCYNRDMLVDSHCHLHDRQFFTEEQARERLARARAAGVSKMVCIGTDVADSLAAREFARENEGVYFTFGIHPNEVDEATKREENLRRLDEFLDSEEAGQVLQDPKCVAIGEVGLDYHFEGFSREAQIALFERMLALAEKKDLPLSFHVREGFSDFFGIVANFPKVRGVVHSFTDSKKVLKRILAETKFFVGVNGLATYSTLPLAPLSRILLETDAPFLAPKPFRGEMNEPAYIREIAEWLAETTGESLEKVAAVTTENVEKLYRI